MARAGVGEVGQLVAATASVHRRVWYVRRMTPAAYLAWSVLVSRIRRPGLDGAVYFHPALIPHPTLAGAEPSLGLPAGQTEDWRFGPSLDGRGVHVQLVGGLWRVHVDRVHPDRSLLEHIRQDAPSMWLVSTTAACAAVGAALGGKSGAAIGGLLGLIAGVASAGP